MFIFTLHQQSKEQASALREVNAGFATAAFAIRSAYRDSNAPMGRVKRNSVEGAVKQDNGFASAEVTQVEVGAAGFGCCVAHQLFGGQPAHVVFPIPCCLGDDEIT